MMAHLIRAFVWGTLVACLFFPERDVAQITFASPVNYPVGPTPVAIVTGDFNGDGKLDLAVTNADGSAAGNDIVSILLGNGDGTFQAAVNYKVGLNPISIAVADLNLDNKQDIAVAFHGSVGTGQTGGVSLLLGNGDGTFQPAINLASNDYPQGIVAGDFQWGPKPNPTLFNIFNIHSPLKHLFLNDICTHPS